MKLQVLAPHDSVKNESTSSSVLLSHFGDLLQKDVVHVQHSTRPLVVHDVMLDNSLVFDVLLPLARALAVAIANEKMMTGEQVFQAIDVDQDGFLSMLDLQSAWVRFTIDFSSRAREGIEGLHRLLDVRGSGLVCKEDWLKVFAILPLDAHTDAQMTRSSVLQRIEEDFITNDDDCLSIDLASDLRDAPAAFDRTREERISRSLRVFATALLAQCRADSLMTDVAFFDDDQKFFLSKDLDSIAHAWRLDISADDLKILKSHLTGGASTDSITRDSWDAVLEPEQASILTLMNTLTVVASALWWDVRSVWDAYPLTTVGERKSLVPETISLDDFKDTNDVWQFCLSDEQVALLFQYMDSSNNGRVSRRSWVAAIEPFYAVIVAMCHCSIQQLNSEILSISVPPSSLSEFKSKFQSEHEGLPSAHIRIFYDHLAKPTDGGSSSIEPGQWAAALDLIQTAHTLPVSAGRKYPAILQHSKQEMAAEHVALILMRQCKLHHDALLFDLSCLCHGKKKNIFECLDTILGLPPRKDICPDGLNTENNGAAWPEVQWRLLCAGSDNITPSVFDLFQEYVDNIDEEGGNAGTQERMHEDDNTEKTKEGGGGQRGDNFEKGKKSRHALEEFVQQIIWCLCEREAVRGATLLALLLASHDLSIEDGYGVFCDPKKEIISFHRFEDIFQRLAPSFGINGPRIESLFLALAGVDSVPYVGTFATSTPLATLQDAQKRWVEVFASTVSVLSVKEMHVDKDRWDQKLRNAARSVGNAHFQRVLLSKRAVPNSENQDAEQQQTETDPQQLYGERQRLRDIFFDDKIADSTSGAEVKRNYPPKSRLFINSEQLKKSLAKTGVISFVLFLSFSSL